MALLQISEQFLRAELLEGSSNCRVALPSILLNIGIRSVQIEKEILQPRASSLFAQISIARTDDLLIIQSKFGFSAMETYPAREKCMKQWQHIHEIFPLPSLKNTMLWRSDKKQIGATAFNFWFAAAGTDCGIHNEHDFLEIHTQIWGTGHMQKFHQKDATTMYQDIVMTPGFTHQPFCDESHVYPWHRYFADTDCVWLAVEYSS
jgi:hypothetical protein